MEQFQLSRRKILSVAKAMLAAYGVTAVLLLILALLLLKLNLSEGIVAVGIMATYLISCFLGGFLLGKGIGKNKFLWGLVLGAVYFLLLIILSAVATPGAFGGFGRMMSTLLLCAAGGMAGGMFS